ncbi:MAG: bifunctional adenosylcobinamide kinase/adenosylcobinamide-phosphate guanylyltransferase [Desulfobulbus propionicus]|nr:MAG: bifunctional adenosylcobinamide kinase/adenosylcobinamide-phosphate guanylyltransferase [Desulfobulbus propionicus]
MGTLTLVTGGARSGKSSFAEQQISSLCTKVAYIATAQVFDQEMEDRVQRHRLQRPLTWTTYEEPWSPASVFPRLGDECEAVLVDCLTILISNLILREQSIDWDAPEQSALNTLEEVVALAMEELFIACCTFTGSVFMVTNEVGQGIVPDTPLGRFFRDCSGRVNQRAASLSDTVYLVVAGIPVKIKGD